MEIYTSTITIIAIIEYYFLIFKPNQDEKNRTKKDCKTEMAPFDWLINDNPTNHRNKR